MKGLEDFSTSRRKPKPNWNTAVGNSSSVVPLVCRPYMTVTMLNGKGDSESKVCPFTKIKFDLDKASSFN